MINCKVELKLKWAKYCAFSAGGTENFIHEDANANSIIFIIKDTKLYVPVITLSGRDSQKLPKIFSKGFERSLYWNEYKTKSENKNTANEYRYFFKSNFLGFNRLFILFYTNAANNAKRFNARKFYLPKRIIKN